jgi:hypothetical protein
VRLGQTSAVSRSVRSCRVCAGLAALLIVSCESSKSETRVVQTSPATNLQFVTARAAAADGFWRTCCARLHGVDYDAGDWRDAGQIDPFWVYYDRIQPSVQAHLAYDPALGAECVAGLTQAASSCALTLAASEAIERSCFGYRGIQLPGSVCEDSVECAAPDAGHALCVRGSSMATSVLGTCAVLERGAEGDLCDPFADAGALHFCDPAEGLFCGETGVCERRRTDGSACVRSSRYMDICAAGSYCGDSKTCEPRNAAGAGCSSNSACLSGICHGDTCADAEPVPSAESCGADRAAAAPDAAADAAPDVDVDGAPADAGADAEGGF